MTPETFYAWLNKLDLTSSRIRPEDVKLAFERMHRSSRTWQPLDRVIAVIVLAAVVAAEHSHPEHARRYIVDRLNSIEFPHG